jgi:hypothetical protein
MFNVVGPIIHNQSDTFGPGLETFFPAVELDITAGSAMTLERDGDHIPIGIDIFTHIAAFADTGTNRDIGD